MQNYMTNDYNWLITNLTQSFIVVLTLNLLTAGEIALHAASDFTDMHSMHFKRPPRRRVRVRGYDESLIPSSRELLEDCGAIEVT